MREVWYLQVYHGTASKKKKKVNVLRAFSSIIPKHIARRLTHFVKVNKIPTDSQIFYTRRHEGDTSQFAFLTEFMGITGSPFCIMRI